MLAASPLRNSTDDGRVVDLGGFAAAATTTSSDGLVILDDIDFDDIFIGFDDCDVLPDLEVDPAEIFAEFSASGEDETSSVSVVTPVAVEASGGGGEQEQEKVVQEAMESDGGGAEVEKKREEEDGAATVTTKPSSESDRGRKSGSPGPKNAQGKRKVKVDWTPELHRRFVQAVEQLGVDKAVPSRILELMGIECLTRHNIASHLQKYRSHRKHLLAREAEAASWSQRRQMYAAAAASGGAVTKREVAPWLTPTIGFPPPPVQPFRPPLHVWGHPTVDQPPMLHMWPRHLVPSPPWAPQPPLQPPVDSSFWHPHFQRGGKEGWIPGAVTPGTPCFPQPMRFPVQAVPGIVPHALYSPHNAVPSKQPGTQFQFETHPSKESIDAAIGDVLAKPWLPLPLGLKPPSLDSVIVELQRQGISRVPPTCG